MPVATELLTVEEYRRLNLPDNGTIHELHSGRLVEMTRPKHRHIYLQHRIAELMRPIAGRFGEVMIEFPFRALPEHELRAADVAVISFDRLAAIDPDDNLHGAPELVVEVESPSNTSAELDEKEALCLANGCKEFWIVYPKRKLVRVTTADTLRRYTDGQAITISLLGGSEIAVADIFAPRRS